MLLQTKKIVHFCDLVLSSVLFNCFVITFVVVSN